MPTYGQYSEGQHRAESEAIGRLRELAEEYAGTAVGADYAQQWQAAVAASDPGGHDYADEEAMDYPPFGQRRNSDRSKHNGPGN